MEDQLDDEAPSYEEHLDQLVRAAGYSNREHVYEELMGWQPVRTSRGLSPHDARLVLRSLEELLEEKEEIRGDAGSDPERPWAIAGGSLAGGAWLLAPFTIVTWVCTLVGSITVGLWVWDRAEGYLGSMLPSQYKEEE